MMGQPLVQAMINLGIYRHFIGELQRFTMVPLATAIGDERAVSGLLPNAPVKSTA